MTTWTATEITVMAAAVRQAPSVHNTQPWILEFRDRSVSLFERLDLALPQHDPTGRDRLISCGAALTNLRLAMGSLGWETRVLLFPDQLRHDEVARVVAADRRQQSTTDNVLYAAIPRRRSYRKPFTRTPVSRNVRDELRAAATMGGVEIRPVGDALEATMLAGLLEHAGLVLRQNNGYQHELAVWTNSAPGRHPGGGLPAPALLQDTLPWTGLVRSTTALPNCSTLAARLRRECLLLLQTPDDGLVNHVLAGDAIQRIWLTATHAGLAGSVLTQPLQVPEVRAGLIEHLDLAGFPQALLRFGYPIDTTPPSPRVPVGELIRPAARHPEESTP